MKGSRGTAARSPGGGMGCIILRGVCVYDFACRGEFSKMCSQRQRKGTRTDSPSTTRSECSKIDSRATTGEWEFVSFSREYLWLRLLPAGPLGTVMSTPLCLVSFGEHALGMNPSFPSKHHPQSRTHIPKNNRWVRSARSSSSLNFLGVST